MTSNKHINIPVFIPHMGCPNDCVFCNQRIISGVNHFDADSVIPIIEEALSTIDESVDAEIAFFGGSFTGIEFSLMEKLLKISNDYLKCGRITSVRCSTRPDYINDTVLQTLIKYGIGTVELGIQSVSDDVLLSSSRGHDFAAIEYACKKIKEYGLRLGGQMMIGLPGADEEDEKRTAEFIVSAGADEARIYPTIVFKHTKLCDMTIRSEYNPLEVDEAVRRAAAAFEIFVKAGIKVLRIGLCDSDNLHNDSTYFAGPNHPAMGELVEGEYYYNLIKDKLLQYNFSERTDITVFVHKGHLSKAIGQHKKNKIRLIRDFPLYNLKFSQSDDVQVYDVLPKIEERKNKCI